MVGGVISSILVITALFLFLRRRKRLSLRRGAVHVSSNDSRSIDLGILSSPPDRTGMWDLKSLLD